MPTVFEGEPDARQDDETIRPSRFRPRYRALTTDELALHDDLKRYAAALEGLIEQLPVGRYRSLAITALEEAVMWAVKELTA